MILQLIGSAEILQEEQWPKLGKNVAKMPGIGDTPKMYPGKIGSTRRSHCSTQSIHSTSTYFWLSLARFTVVQVFVLAAAVGSGTCSHGRKGGPQATVHRPQPPRLVAIVALRMYRFLVFTSRRPSRLPPCAYTCFVAL